MKRNLKIFAVVITIPLWLPFAVLYTLWGAAADLVDGGWKNL